MDIVLGSGDALAHLGIGLRKLETPIVECNFQVLINTIPKRSAISGGLCVTYQIFLAGLFLARSSKSTSFPAMLVVDSSLFNTGFLNPNDKLWWCCLE